jgi:hypothetical protein
MQASPFRPPINSSQPTLREHPGVGRSTPPRREPAPDVAARPASNSCRFVDPAGRVKGDDSAGGQQEHGSEELALPGVDEPGASPKRSCELSLRAGDAGAGVSQSGRSDIVRSECATPYPGDVRSNGRKQECAAGGAA